VNMRTRTKLLQLGFVASFCPTLAIADSNGSATTAPLIATAQQIVVTGQRRALLGSATTSSQGIVDQIELQLTPAYRAGQLLETVPGLVATVHSGEGKANQYLLRGFNLDHGTDLATFIDGMPVNERTHAHGQGYTDLNFMIPDLVTGITYTKGPYYAAEGDFASVGSVRLGYANDTDTELAVTAGTLGFQRLLATGSHPLGGGNALGAVELQHYDGPWDHSDNQRKANAVLRYSQGDVDRGFSLTGMYYRGLWNATTDQPERAMSASYMQSIGATPIGRFGTLDPSDGGDAQRFSLSAQDHMPLGAGHLSFNAYAINNRLTLWNNFTHFLEDPVNGDQHAQTEARGTYGGAVSYDLPSELAGLNNDFVIGADTRYDDVHVSLHHTKARMFLASVEDDQVSETSVGGYAQATTHWTDWLRTIMGVREDYVTASDKGTNAGDVSQALFQPKGSLIIRPWENFEFYISAGRGYHTDDVRGATQAAGAPLIARSTGEEIGLRANPAPNFTTTLTLFQIDFQSEITYDPDVGEDEAGPASRRYGAELNLTYYPLHWLEFYGSIAATHARFKTPDDDGFGHVGRFIADAPDAIGQFGIYVRNLTHWSGALELRYLGKHPLTPDNSITSPGYAEWDMEAGYAWDNGVKLKVGFNNLFNSHRDAADYYYGDRVSPTEPVSDPVNGNGDVHIHPLEPFSARLTLSKTFS